MNTKAFDSQVDELFFKIEEWIERSQSALDFEMQQGILTIFLPKGSQLILSRQAALQEVWLASKLGAYHFRCKGKEWVTEQGQKLLPTLAHIIQDQANVILDLQQILE